MPSTPHRDGRRQTGKCEDIGIPAVDPDEHRIAHDAFGNQIEHRVQRCTSTAVVYPPPDVITEATRHLASDQPEHARIGRRGFTHRAVAVAPSATGRYPRGAGPPAKSFGQ